MADAVSVKKELNWMKAHLLFPGSFALEFLPPFFFYAENIKIRVATQQGTSYSHVDTFRKSVGSERKRPIIESKRKLSQIVLVPRCCDFHCFHCTTRLLIAWFLVKYHSEMKCFSFQ